MTEGLAGFRPRPRAPGTSARRLTDPPPQRLLDRATAGLAEPFVGITTDGETLPGLFSIQKTGVAVEPIARAVEAYLAMLTPEQRASGTFDVDDERTWRSWSNVHPFLLRHGVCLELMTEQQRELAFGVLQASLSAPGFELSRDIMRLNAFIGDITGRHEEYGDLVYWLSLMGMPSNEHPWGWQIDGHHLNINCFVLGDQVVMTPMFMGSEPVAAETGRFAGTRVFGHEEARGLAFMQSLPPAVQKQARIGTKHPSEAAGFCDNLVIPQAGVRFGEFAPDAQQGLLELVELYLGRMRPGLARVKKDEVVRHLDDTTFAWVGDCDDDSVFYYRIQSPVVLIEFDHQAGIALDNDQPSRNHIHTVIRTPNGNDYGRDLLRQHYARFDHVGGAHVPR